MAPKQVQGEMGVMGCDWCHFVIWIEGGLYVKESDSWADIWVRRRPFLVEKKDSTGLAITKTLSSVVASVQFVPSRRAFPTQ